MRNKTSKSDIPNSRAETALAVTDGGDCIGRIVEHGGVYFAFGTNDALIGAFATQREAMCALPPARTSS